MGFRVCFVKTSSIMSFYQVFLYSDFFHLKKSLQVNKEVDLQVIILLDSQDIPLPSIAAFVYVLSLLKASKTVSVGKQAGQLKAWNLKPVKKRE